MKVQPKARRPGVQGVMPAANGPRLRIGVSEAAEHGKANRAACLTLAQAPGVSPSTVTVTVAGGASNRQKVMHVSGNPIVLSARLAAL